MAMNSEMMHLTLRALPIAGEHRRRAEPSLVAGAGRRPACSASPALPMASASGSSEATYWSVQRVVGTIRNLEAAALRPGATGKLAMVLAVAATVT